MRIIKHIIRTSLLWTATCLLLLCSCENNEYPNELEPETNNQIPDGPNNSITSKSYSDDITHLFIGNITLAGKGERLEIMGPKKATFAGNDNYFSNLGLKDEDVIISISGGSKYTDGTAPTNYDDVYSPYNLQELDKPNVTISYVERPKEEANAYILTQKEFVLDRPYANHMNNEARSISEAMFIVHAREDRLQDEVPPLGQDGGEPYTSFEFTDIDTEDLKFNTTIQNGFNPNISSNEFLIAKFKESDTLWIKVIENGVVKKGERLDIIQPK